MTPVVDFPAQNLSPFEKKLNALLADLQNTVPGKLKPIPGSKPHNVTFSDETTNGTSPAYALKKTPDPVIEYEEREVPIHLNGSGLTVNGGSNSLPRHHLNGSNGALNGFNGANGGAGHGNLSELDSLLEDLSNARYNNQPLASKHNSVSYAQPQSPTTYINDSIKRPSTDSLLDEFSTTHTSSPLYAVPHMPRTPDDQKHGKHVSITVRETTLERMRGTPSEQYLAQGALPHSSLNKAPVPYTSSATKELDDLMASLSDFKVSQSSYQQPTVTDNAKPNQGTASFESSNTTIVTKEHPNGELEYMLDKLQTKMSSEGINTPQKGCCNACEKPIVGQVITALGRTWHPEHFVCNHCREELGTKNFFERDGAPYCEPDYHNLFSPRCAYCNGPILDKCVTALDKTWHTEHFFCAQCGNQFGDEGFHEKDGKPYCRNDYFDMFAPKCTGCNRAIMENYISALNSQWHPDCFVCRDCKKPVTGKSFYAMEGHPVCPPCVGVEED